MTLHPLNVLDALILVTLAWNLLRGFNKGFVEEVISILGIVASLFLAFKFSHKTASLFVQNPSPQTILISGFLIYLFSFSVFKYVAFYVDKRLSQTPLGILNSILGVLFGIVRGLVIASVFVVFIAFLAPKSYLIEKSYLGGACVPVIDYVVKRLPKEAKDKILNRWLTARSYLLKNWSSWKSAMEKGRGAP